MPTNQRPFLMCDASLDASPNTQADAEPVAFCVTCPCRGRVPFCACGLGHEDPEDEAVEEVDDCVQETKQQVSSALWTMWKTPNWKHVALAAGMTALLMYAAVKKPAPLMRLQSFVRAV